MRPDFFVAVLPALIELGKDLFKQSKGDHSAAIRAIARIRAHGSAFIEADKVARAELEELAKK